MKLWHFFCGSDIGGCIIYPILIFFTKTTVFTYFNWLELLTDAKFSDGKLHDIAFMELRSAIGVIFIVQGSGKFNPGAAGFLTSLGIPAEMQIPIALAETISGILLIFGVLSRISSSILSIIMLSAIFLVKEASNLTGPGATH